MLKSKENLAVQVIVLMALKKQSGYSTREFANMCHVTDRAMQLWMRGDRKMPEAHLELLRIKLGAHPRYKPIQT
jgi:DNA-binding transcriptional regulator YiaG